MFFRSIAFKLTLAFVAIAVLGVGLVSYIINQRVRQQFDNFVISQFEDNVARTASRYYDRNESWDGIGQFLAIGVPVPNSTSGNSNSGNGNRGNGNSGGGNRENPPPRLRDPENIAIIDLNRKVVYSGLGNLQAGTVLQQGDLENEAILIPIKDRDSDDTIGYLITDRAGATAPRAGDLGPEGAFLSAVNSASIMSAAGVGLVALIIGIVLANTLARPLRKLTTATMVVAEGNLGHQVDVSGKDEIGTLAQAFNKMSADLDQAQRVRRQMTADIAHDLRTPLSVILGYTEALSDGKLEGDLEIYEAIYQEAEQLNHLIDDLRTLSLADAGELTLNQTPIPVAEIFQRAQNAFRMQAESQNVDLHIIESSELQQTVSIDRDRFAQVLTNLISNALRYTPSNGQITMSAQRIGEWVSLKIADNGSGISADHLPHIFDRFYRVDASRNQAGGESGLGLAIVKSLVEAHGGRISASSAINQGTAFSIELPLTHSY